jgi:hypothetical protein
LSDADAGWLDAARVWVKSHFTDDVEAKYAPVEGKLRLVGAILANDWVLPTETWKLQALGAAFGDALSQELMLDWVTVEDELGATAALNWPGTSLLSFPLTAISKRVERSERVDVRSCSIRPALVCGTWRFQVGTSEAPRIGPSRCWSILGGRDNWF